ncbi:MAG: MFS transporter [Chloroflexi bacterium]|nr:MFS transporter [Chloroflexota bacterium]
MNRHDVFYGWKVLAAAGWLRVLAGGFHSFAFAILFLPVSRDLNLSRTAASLIFSLARAEGAMEGPIAGHLVDRFGSRIIMTLACLVIGIGYLLLSQAYDFASFTLIYVLVISVGSGFGFVHAASALANHWFFQRRALALAIINASLSLGGALFAPVFAVIVNQYGWRTAALVSGAVFLVAGLPVTRLIYSTPEDKGLAPLGALKAAAETSRAKPQDINHGDNNNEFTARQAMRTAGFWLLVTGGFLRVVGFSAINVHFIPILMWKGVAEQTAAYYLGAMVAFSIPAAIILGITSDRFYRPRVMSLGMVLGAVATLFLLFGGERSQFLFIPLIAAVEALYAVVRATLGDFYGRRHFATISGFVTLFVTSGSMLGPVIAGLAYDRTGGYSLAIQVSLASFALSAISFWMLRRPGRGVR